MSDDDVQGELYGRLEVLRGDANKRKRKARLARAAFTAVAVLIVVAAGIAIALKIPESGTHEISGTVQCVSGQDVQGIWIKESEGSGDFAGWEADPADPSRARYIFDLRGDTYAVHVGCGGSRDRWLREIRSDYVTGSHNDFICHDAPTEADFRKCLPV